MTSLLTFPATSCCLNARQAPTQPEVQHLAEAQTPDQLAALKAALQQLSEQLEQAGGAGGAADPEVGGAGRQAARVCCCPSIHRALRSPHLLPTADSPTRLGFVLDERLSLRFCRRARRLLTSGRSGARSCMVAVWTSWGAARPAAAVRSWVPEQLGSWMRRAGMMTWHRRRALSQQIRSRCSCSAWRRWSWMRSSGGSSGSSRLQQRRREQHLRHRGHPLQLRRLPLAAAAARRRRQAAASGRGSCWASGWKIPLPLASLLRALGGSSSSSSREHMGAIRRRSSGSRRPRLVERRPSQGGWWSGLQRGKQGRHQPKPRLVQQRRRAGRTGSRSLRHSRSRRRRSECPDSSCGGRGSQRAEAGGGLSLALAAAWLAPPPVLLSLSAKPQVVRTLHKALRGRWRWRTGGGQAGGRWW